jgi:hypothetical protein
LNYIGVWGWQADENQLARMNNSSQLIGERLDSFDLGRTARFKYNLFGWSCHYRSLSILTRVEGQHEQNYRNSLHLMGRFAR